MKVFDKIRDMKIRADKIQETLRAQRDFSIKDIIISYGNNPSCSIIKIISKTNDAYPLDALTLRHKQVIEKKLKEMIPNLVELSKKEIEKELNGLLIIEKLYNHD